VASGRAALAVWQYAEAIDVHKDKKTPDSDLNFDFNRARAHMVQDQLIARGISDERVLRAMREVPRHEFVSEGRQLQAYDDRPLSIGYEQTISQPFIVALMTEALQLEGHEKVLEIGTGSGYQAAILSRLAHQVISVEYIPDLAQTARSCLAKLGYNNVNVIVSDGSIGYIEEAPFDAIMLTAAAPELPLTLKQQLAQGGRLVGPVGARYDQVLVRLQRHAGKWEREILGPVIFVPLVGKHGWQDY
jgi:protein-L-isoaspartate(D-aspartate) O-methyltransferase